MKRHKHEDKGSEKEKGKEAEGKDSSSSLRIAVIGSGPVGSTLGGAWADKGHLYESLCIFLALRLCGGFFFSFRSRSSVEIFFPAPFRCFFCTALLWPRLRFIGLIFYSIE